MDEMWLGEEYEANKDLWYDEEDLWSDPAEWEDPIDFAVNWDDFLSRPAVFKPRLSARLNEPDPWA
jgi:hypothetical protein